MSEVGSPAMRTGEAMLLAHRWIAPFALAAILVAAAAFRLRGLTADSIWLDEADSWREASLGFWATIEATAADVCPSLHTVLLHFWMLCFGDSEYSLRAPSAVLGWVTVAAIYWVGRQIAGQIVGLLSALLLGFSGFHIYFSQEARPYALLALVATVFVGGTIRALESDRPWWHAASAAAAVLLLYSHPYGTLLWLSTLVAVIAGGKSCHYPANHVLANWLRWQAIAFVAYLPWAVVLAFRYQQISSEGFWIQRPDASFVIRTLVQIASGTTMAWVLLVGAVSGLSAPNRLLHRPAEPAGLPPGRAGFLRFILAAWLIGPLVMALVMSLVGTPILYARYLICSLPAALLLSALGFCRLSTILGPWILVAFPLGVMASLHSYGFPHRDDVRRAVAMYRELARPMDCVFVYEDALSTPILYYLRDRPGCFRPVSAAADIRPWELATAHAWLFLGHLAPDKKQAVIDGLEDHQWQVQVVTDGPNFGLMSTKPAQAGQ